MSSTTDALARNRRRVTHESSPRRSISGSFAGGRRLRFVRCVIASGCVGLALVPALIQAAELDLRDTSRMRVGIGDRISHQRRGTTVPTVTSLRRLALHVDMLEIWLPRGWKKDWLPPASLAELHARGVVPVVVHYFFGDDISQERVEAQRDAWYSSMWEMSQLIRGDEPVLVILEPEFNIAPPKGETAITAWPGFADDLRAAAEMIRREAPNALVGTCPGDFPGKPSLEPVLGPVAADLDFIAFQEMRASTDPDASRPGYREVGRAAVDYARYLKRAFDRPLLLGYVAISSQGGWEQEQKKMLAEVQEQSDALRAAGVFGVIYFQLFDDPEHKGYFGEAEKNFGLFTAQGAAKPALAVFHEMAEASRRAARRPTPPVTKEQDQTLEKK
jgi:hypothetical protein